MAALFVCHGFGYNSIRMLSLQGNRKNFLLMKKYIWPLLLASLALQAQTRPKLVVGVVVDQMKEEYLHRFAADFSDNGFKKLLQEGYVYSNMHYNYLPTYTAPGHASIYTGTTPAQHGIVSNEWYSRSWGKERYCTDDDAVQLLGEGKPEEGKMSPKNLLATTITDELRLATNFKGKVIGMSLKDRGAILPAGHFANGAYWYSKTGNFISSTFYAPALPDWVQQFNNEKHAAALLSQPWTLLKPAATYNESLPDDNPYEGRLYKVDKPVFPYDLKGMYEKNDAGVLRSTPFGNDLLALFAERAIEQEQLGQDDITDFLTVSFSATDYIGHTLGPRSMELQDTYLRLDVTLAGLIRYLDQKVGKGNYLLFLTADHAGAENAQFLSDHQYNVSPIDPKTIAQGLRQFSKDTYGVDLIKEYSSFNVFLDRNQIKSKGLGWAEVKQAFKDYLMTQPQVKRVYSEEEILAQSGADYHLDCIAKGYDVTQNGDLVILDKPGYIEYGKTGTSHGTTYSYDTHVPLIFYGWNIPAGRTSARKVITQIAPTLAQKLSIPLPNACQADVLTEVVDRK